MSTLTCPPATPATSGHNDDHPDSVPPRAVPLTEAVVRVASEAPTEITDPTITPVEDAGNTVNRGAVGSGLRSQDDPDLGASTAEYAVIVLAAAAFGGVMAAVLSSDSVSGMLPGIIQKALAI